MPDDLRRTPSRHLASILWVLLGMWAVAIMLLSSLSPQQLPEAAFLFWDKVNHFVAYAVGGWLAAAAIRVSRPSAGITPSIVVAVLALAAFGILDETLQTFTPGRMGGDVDDWVADVLGATAGALLTVPALRRL